jgi:hypothetical protein
LNSPGGIVEQVESGRHRLQISRRDVKGWWVGTIVATLEVGAFQHIPIEGGWRSIGLHATLTTTHINFCSATLSQRSWRPLTTASG